MCCTAELFLKKSSHPNGSNHRGNPQCFNVAESVGFHELCVSLTFGNKYIKLSFPVSLSGLYLH